MSAILLPSQLRAAFARRLSDLYGREVPAYTTLVDVSHEVNRDVVRDLGPDAERLGSIDRVTAERHGAIRVGTPAELAQVARVFGALGMYPTGYYDLRDASPAAVPVVSTAFRPVDAGELARNPFRVFTSLLATPDRRFFSADLARRVEEFLARRQLFAPRLLELADRAEADGGLAEPAAEEFLDLATRSFALSTEPVDRAWYDELTAVSPVAADIAGITSTHINHLTPRVLDIDALYARMTERGITMIDEIQGPPRWDGPDVLLRQTSFRALAEPRRFVEADGSVTTGSLRVRFGEVEARGIALTRSGRELYDQLVAEVDRRLAKDPGLTRIEVAAQVWASGLPRSERDLLVSGVGVFTVTAAADRPSDGLAPVADVASLVDLGWVIAEPVVYEDFLPRSAAGIFRSNIVGDGPGDDGPGGDGPGDDGPDGAPALPGDTGPADDLGPQWLAGVLGRPLLDPTDLYERQSTASWRAALGTLGLPSDTPLPITTARSLT